MSEPNSARQQGPMLERKPSHASGSSVSSNSSSLFAFEDGMMFMTFAAQALSQDEFSKCFEPKPLNYPASFSPLFLFWITGVLLRYILLFSIKLSILLVGSIFFLLLLPPALLSHSEPFKRWLFMTYCRVWLLAFFAIVRHHGCKRYVGEPHLFVANHTSFVDFFLMSSHKFPHATVAQVHGGLFGLLQRYLLSLNGSLSFQRSERRDRVTLSRRMREHVKSSAASPLLIFPEGTCVNNECTVLFHKGAFDLGAVIVPVAIRYNKRLLDPYWNTREQTFTKHVWYMMTRWLVVVDVYWLEPQRRLSNETAIEFAERTKQMISEAAGLKNLSWDGYMKNFLVSHDQEKLKRTSQAKYGTMLRQRLDSEPRDIHAAQHESGPKCQAAPAAHRFRAKRSNSESQIQLVPFGIGSAELNRSQSALSLFPDWLPDSAVVDIKNELMIHSVTPITSPTRPETSSASTTLTSRCHHTLIQTITDQKEDVVKTWKAFSKMHNDSSDEGATRVERRVENGSWRYWHQRTPKKHLPEDSVLEKERYLSAPAEESEQDRGAAPSAITTDVKDA